MSVPAPDSLAQADPLKLPPMPPEVRDWYVQQGRRVPRRGRGDKALKMPEGDLPPKVREWFVLMGRRGGLLGYPGRAATVARNGAISPGRPKGRTDQGGPGSRRRRTLKEIRAEAPRDARAQRRRERAIERERQRLAKREERLEAERKKKLARKAQKAAAKAAAKLKAKAKATGARPRATPARRRVLAAA